MWVVFACLSALFAGITAILAKCGVKKTDSSVATALRTIVVLIFATIMVFIANTQKSITEVSFRSWIFLILSGISTGASWLCYFKALQTGKVDKVAPIDKSSTILTILLSFILLKETVTLWKIFGVIIMGIGTFLMIAKPHLRIQSYEKEQFTNTTAIDSTNSQGKITSVTIKEKNNKSWLFYAILSAIFASLTTILSKLGIENVESNLATAIRTTVVLVMAWLIVFVTGKGKKISATPKKELLFIFLSGIATGASWICYFKALQTGETSIVVSIDKLSTVITITFSYIFLKEKLSLKAFIGLILLVVGTFVMLI